MNTHELIAQRWVSYAKANKLRTGTQAYWKAQHAFINGANCLCGDEGLPAIVQIYVMSGRDIADLLDPQTA